MRNKIFSKKTGVTMVALVTTIVILLILAGITIAVLTGENGIIERTKRAQYAQDVSDTKEDLMQKWYVLLDETKREYLTHSEMASRLQTKLKEEDSLATAAFVAANDTIEVFYNGHEFEIQANKYITANRETAKRDLKETWDRIKNESEYPTIKDKTNKLAEELGIDEDQVTSGDNDSNVNIEDYNGYNETIKTSDNGETVVEISTPKETEKATVGEVTITPASIEIFEGKDASFSATAETTGNVSYQWYSIEKNATIGGKEVKGSTTDTLSFTDAKVSDSKYYYCEISSTQNGKTKREKSAAVRLTVVSKITVAELDKDKIVVNEGETVEIKLDNTNGEGGEITYQWYKNDTNSNTGGTPIEGANSSTLEKTNTKPDEDDGYYYLVITQKVGDETNTVTTEPVKVNIKTPLSIETQPSGKNEMEGYPAEISVETKGNGTVSYQWYKSDTNSNTGGTPIEGANSSTLKIDSLDKEDDGYYYCEVRQIFEPDGTDTTIKTNAVKITVEDKVGIETQPTSQEAIEGLTATFTVETKGAGEISYQWYKNTTNSNTGGTPIDNTNSNIYKKSLLEVGDAGYYYVVVTQNYNGHTETVTSDPVQLVVKPVTISATEKNVSMYIVDSNKEVTITGENLGTLFIETPSNNDVANVTLNNGKLTITPKGVGTTSVTVKESNAGKTVTIDIEIKKPTTQVTITPETVSVNYDTENTIKAIVSNTPAIDGKWTVTSSNTNVIEIISGNGATAKNGEETQIKYKAKAATEEDTTITIVFTPNDTKNYDTITKTVTISAINKVDATNPSTVTGYTGAYDGNPHTITVSNDFVGGTLQYSTDGTNWSSEKPTITNFGTVTVYVRVLGDSNHNTTQPITVTMKVGTTTMTVEDGNYTGKYDGKAHTITLNVTTPSSGYEIYYSTKQALTADDISTATKRTAAGASTTKPSRTLAGTTTVYWYIKSNNSNYADKTGSNTITISKESNPLTVGNPDVQYTGATIDLASLVNGAQGNVTYSIKTNGTTTASTINGSKVTLGAMSPNNDDNQSVVVTVTAAGNDNYQSASKDITITVQKYTRELSYKNTVPASIEYDKTATAEVTISGNGGTANDISKVTYQSNNTNVIEVNGTTLKAKASTGEATITATLPRTTTVKQATADKTITVSKQKLTLPIQSGSVTYNGSNQSPNWDGNYNQNILTIGGTTSAKDAGTYEATFSIKDTTKYQWSDGTTASKTATWTIAKKAPTFSINPSTLNVTYGTTGTITITYDGDGAISATSSDTSKATVSVSGKTITVTGAGAGTATITIKTAEGTNYLAGADKTCSVTIAPAKLTIPSQKGTLTYNGGNQSPQWNNYDSNLMTLGGTTTGKDAKSYNATFTLKNTTNYQWSDGKTEVKTVAWSIGKKAPTFSINSSTLSVTYGATGTITITYDGDGALSATSSDTSKATVSVSGKTVTVTGAGAGTATITVKAAVGTNYLAGTDKTCNVTVGTATMTSSASNYTGTYDGKSHTITGPTVTKPTSGTTIYYSTKQALTADDISTEAKRTAAGASTTKPSRTDAGTTTVYWYIKSNSVNYADKANYNTITINRKALTESSLSIATGPNSNLNNWSINNSSYQSRFNMTYNESTQMTDIVFTGGSGWESLYMPIVTTPGQTYTFTCDYKNLVAFTTLNSNGYDGIGLQALNSVPKNSNNIDNGNAIETSYLPKAINNTVQTYNLTFTATGPITYISFNLGMCQDNKQLQFSIGNCTLSNNWAYIYDGTAKTVTTVVKDTTANKTLTKGTDYTVAYSNNTNIGTATATLTGIGNYSATKATNFTIAKKPTADITYDYSLSNTLLQTYAAGTYSNTGYNINWDEDFTIETTVNVPTLGKRYIIAGGYDGTSKKELQLEISASNAFRVYLGIGGHDKTSGTIKAGEDITVTFKWTASTKSYVATAVGATTGTITINNNNVAGTTYETSGTAANGLRIGCVDYRGNSTTFNPITVKSFKATGSQEYNDPVKIPTTDKQGFTFNGWFTAATGGTQITSATTVPQNATTYYAHWTANNYTANFNGNGGTDGTAITKAYGTALGTLPTSTRTGYTFNGWFTAATGGTQISTTTTMPLNGTTYYAHWVDDVKPTITSATPSTTWDIENYVDFNATDAGEGINGYAITTSATAPTEWIPIVDAVEAHTETKRELSAAWARVFHHNAHWGKVLYANETEAKSSDTVDKYSVLGNIANYKNSANWEFLLQYPELSGYNRWTQTGNPITTNNSAVGYTAVGTPSLAYNSWGGLALSSTPSATFIDGSPGVSNWHYAIGAYSRWRCGIPGPASGISHVNLWSRIDNLTNTTSANLTRRLGDLNENRKYYVWVKDSSGNTNYKEVTTSKVDINKPTATITSTNNVAASQTATLTIKDNIGAVSYYWGTSNPETANIAWTDITSTTSTTVSKNVSNNGTYYLAVQDAAGNRTVTNKTFYKTTLIPVRGTVTPTTIVTMAGNAVNLPNPAASGATFTGWYTDITAGTKQNTAYTPTSNLTLYGHWTQSTYQLSVNPNGGTWNSSTSTQTFNQYYGTDKTIANPTRAGYDFTGWTLTGSGWFGQSMHSDSKFASGQNGVVVYNNAGNGTVTIDRQAKSADNWVGDNELKVTTSKSATPGMGGFFHNTTAAASQSFIHVFIAKLPVGYSFHEAMNSIGDGLARTGTWLTSRAGTGGFEVYAYRVDCGSTGPFSTFGHVYVEASDLEAPIFYVAYSDIINVTNTKGTKYVFGTAAGTLKANWQDTTAPTKPTYTANYTSGNAAYTSGNWAKTEVYTTISSTDAGSGIKEVQYSKDNKATWTKLNLAKSGGIKQSGTTYTGQETWTASNGRNDTIYFRVVDNSGNISEVSDAFNIKYDTAGPTVAFGTNGNSTASKTASTKVTVTDTYSGVKASTLKYLWTTRTSGITAADFTGTNSGTFTSGGTVTLPSGNAGEYYLYIYGEDNVGNTVLTNSNKFVVSNITPEADISVSTAWSSSGNTITIKPYAPTVLYDTGYVNTTTRDKFGTQYFPTASYTGQRFRVTGTVKTVATADTTKNTGIGFNYLKKSDGSNNWQRVYTVSTGTAQTEQSFNGIYTVPSEYKEGLRPWYQIDIASGTAGYNVEYKNVKYEYFDYTKIASVTVDGTAVTVTNGTATFNATENKTYTIVITDIYGNTKTYTKAVGNVDQTAPTINANNITYGQSLNITIADVGSGVKGWQVTNSSTKPTSEWTEITATSSTNVTETGLTAGTWYVWAKDAVGNAQSKQVTVSKATPTVTLSATSAASVTYNATGTFKAKSNVAGTLTATSNGTSYVTITGGASNTATANTDYTITYKGAGYRTSATTITVKIAPTDTANYNEGTATFTVSKVNKAANPIAVTASQSWSEAFATSAKTKTLTAATGAQGAVTYAIKSQKDKSSNDVTYFSIADNTKAVLTRAASTPVANSNYTVVITATAAGNTNYNSGSKDITVTVTVSKAGNPIAVTASQSWSEAFATSAKTKTLTAATGAQGAVTYAIKSQKNTAGTTVSNFSIADNTKAVLTRAANTPVAGSNYTVVITATAAGNANYNSGSKDITVTVTVSKAQVAIPTSPAAKTYNGAIQSCGITTPANTSIVTNPELVTNGNGSYKNNTNFTNWTYDSGNSYNGSTGSFRYATKNTIVTNEYFALSTQDASYTLSLDAKTTNGTSTYYAMIICYDIDKKEMSASNYMYIGGSTTTLSQDLKNGDTVVHFTNLSGWNTTTSATHQKGFIFWNYKNSLGYQYPPESYSRNVFLNKYAGASSIDVNAGTITLSSAWNGGTIPAGTAVSQSSSGGTYKYIALSNTKVPTSWTHYTGTMSGIDYTGNNVSNLFPQYAAYGRVGFLWNYNNVSDTGYITNVSVTGKSVTSATNAGTYSVDYKLNDSANFEWSDGTTTNKSVPWVINPYDITSNGSVGAIATQTYTGSNITPNPTITALSKTLTKDTDYNLTYKNNKNAGTATVYIVGKGNFKGSRTTTFTIGKATPVITLSAATVASVNYNATGTFTAKPNVAGTLTATSNGTSYVSITGGASNAAAANTAYTITYKGVGYRASATTITVKLAPTDTANYNEGTATFTVSKVNKAANPIAVTASQSWSEAFATSAKTKTLTAATGAQGAVTYAIKSQKDKSSNDVTYFSIADNTKAVLTRAASTPVANSNYTVVITATAAGNANYNSGSKDITVTVTVSKAGNPIAVTASQSWSETYATSAKTKTLTAATGAQGAVTYAIKSQKDKSSNAVTYFSIADNTKAVLTRAASTPVANSNYTVVITATAAGNANYNSGSKEITVTVTVTKATPTITLSATSAAVTYNATGTFDATVKSTPNCAGTLTATSGGTSYVSITGGASNSITATSAGVKKTITYKGVGYRASATAITVAFTPTDTNNFNSATSQSFSVTKVNSATMTVASGNYPSSGTAYYDGSAHTITGPTVTTPSSGTTIYYSTTMALTKDNYSDTSTASGHPGSTTTKPSRTAAGTTTVYWYVKNSNSNYADQSGSNTITITKATIAAPTNVAVTTAGYVTWTNSANATSYEISTKSDFSENKVTATTGATATDYFAKITAATGTRTVYVRGVNSDSSNYTTPGTSANKAVTVYQTKIQSNNTTMGAVDTATYNVISGATVSVSSNKLTIKGVTTGTTTKNLKTVTATAKTGYSFSSWSKTSGSITAATTITATFEGKVYTITLNNQGATTAGTTAIYEKYNTGYYTNSSATTQMTTSTNPITVPVKNGYVFNGYYTAETGGTKYINETGYVTSSATGTAGIKNFTANGTLYAQWEEVTLKAEDYNTSKGVFDTGISTWWVKKISFVTSISGHTVDNTTCWDVSSVKDSGQVLMWISSGNTTDGYEIVFGQNGGVKAPKSCQYLFKSIGSHSAITSLNKDVEIDFTNFDTSNVTNMSNMFEDFNVKNLDLRKLDTSSVTNMDSMFEACSNMESINLTNFNTSNVTDMGCMFMSCTIITSMDLSSFNTSNVTDMGAMFQWCNKLTSINLSSFDTSMVTTMSSMFYECNNLSNLNLANFNTASVTRMARMFDGCTSLSSLNVSSFNTSLVTDMELMFGRCESLTNLDVSSFNTSKVTDMKEMFYQCKNLTTLNLNNFNTAAVTNMGAMFRQNYNLISLNLSSFDTSAVTYMGNMFYYCNNLKTLDLSSFNTAAVTRMNYMFERCEGLTTIYVSNNFVTTAVTDGSSMFAICSSKLKGGAGTIWSSSHVNYDYAHIDGGTSNPGYFTNVSAKPTISVGGTNIKNVADITTKYGQTTTYKSISHPNINWQLFYADTNYYYVIASDYVPNAELPCNGSTVNGVTYGAKDLVKSIETRYQYSTYAAGFSSSTSYNDGVLTAGTIYANGSASTAFTATAQSRYMTTNYLKWVAQNPTSTNDNICSVAYMMDTNKWQSFADGLGGAFSIGGPTLEMVSLSWNAVSGHTKMNDYTKIAGNTGGITVSSPESGANFLGTTTNMWFISEMTKCQGYYLASPGGNGNSSALRSNILWRQCNYM